MKKLLVILLLMTATPALAADPQRVRLDVPLVKQGKMLCGPATIEMLFRYWGVNEYDQYQIAESILHQFAGSERYVKSGIMNTAPLDWNKYPGTGTINIREFLKRFAQTRNTMLENEPPSQELKIIQGADAFQQLREHLAHGVPVIVHQYWKLPKSQGHYRIVTGYDEGKREVYLNDADGGKHLVQTYDEFMKLWNVNERWMHFNAIAFNVDGRLLEVRL